jgi:hypothetical protein
MKLVPKRRRRHRKPAVKDVRCSVRVIVGGRTVESIRRDSGWDAARPPRGGETVAEETPAIGQPEEIRGGQGIGTT